MPQMAPMYWVFLLIMFSIMLMVCISLIYFLFIPSTPPQKINLINMNNNNNNLPWKW
uniref:ATP synthase complex subunit 8 n=1 Tax=Stenocephus fraxini TaxID=2963023 RepID=A0A9E8YZP2_9HYME|nr:ATP synthase F0 subunit 8 [Stenocephus fraxini]WAK85071.1 ATP synthase F0 subunit 8 [Stenocephus fraxini]